MFSSYILGKNGVVYGCAANGIEVRHIRVDSISELRKLQGSKYVQSDVRGMFRQVKKTCSNSAQYCLSEHLVRSQD